MKRLGTPMTAAALLLAVLELDSASGSAELVAVLASGTPPLAGSCCGDPPPATSPGGVAVTASEDLGASCRTQY
eukprot:COSAG01_NODE_7110_length_3341_cov_8.571736_4_plen_74_part_00